MRFTFSTVNEFKRESKFWKNKETCSYKDESIEHFERITVRISYTHFFSEKKNSRPIREEPLSDK